MKKLVILGCTGSIGTQALDIVAGSEELQVVGLAAGSSWEAAVEQAGRHGVATIATTTIAAKPHLTASSWIRVRRLIASDGTTGSCLGQGM
jgi:1-deoxy-D-xylulose 5-phosphate reductoisomerase